MFGWSVTIFSPLKTNATNVFWKMTSLHFRQWKEKVMPCNQRGFEWSSRKMPFPTLGLKDINTQFAPLPLLHWQGHVCLQILLEILVPSCVFALHLHKSHAFSCLFAENGVKMITFSYVKGDSDYKDAWHNSISHSIKSLHYFYLFIYFLTPMAFNF